MKDLRSINVRELLMQRAPFLIVGRLLYCDESSTISETTIESKSMFVDNGKLSSSGLIENIAQTCAMRIGYLCKYVYKIEISLGYIGAIRNLRIRRLPCVNEIITTTVNVKGEVFNMTLVDAMVKSDGDILATGEMKIAMSGDIKNNK